MSTANFSVLNARGYYAMNEFNDRTADDVQMKAERRADAASFRTRDDWEPRGCFVRDRGHIVLDYVLPFVDLPGACSYLGLTGEIVIRPGYYAGAVLDWNLQAELTAGREFDRWNLSEWDAVDLLDDAVATWADGQEEEQGEGGAGRGVARAIREALEGAAGVLDGICRELCDVPLGCAGVASNGEDFYYALSYC